MTTSKNNLLLDAQDVADTAREALLCQAGPLPMSFVAGNVDDSKPSLIAYGYQNGRVCLKRVRVPSALLSRASAWTLAEKEGDNA